MKEKHILTLSHTTCEWQTERTKGHYALLQYILHCTRELSQNTRTKGRRVHCKQCPMDTLHTVLPAEAMSLITGEKPDD